MTKDNMLTNLDAKHPLERRGKQVFDSIEACNWYGAKTDLTDVAEICKVKKELQELKDVCHECYYCDHQSTGKMALILSAYKADLRLVFELNSGRCVGIWRIKAVLPHITESSIGV